VEVLGRQRKEVEVDLSLLAWKGGAIVASLEASKDLWISAHEWSTGGDKYLKERAPFSW